MFFKTTHSTRLFFTAFLIAFIVLVPSIVFAQNILTEGIVPCGDDGEPSCDFGQLIQLVQNLITFALIIAAPLAAIMFAYAGFLYLTAAGETGKISKAHSVFMTVFWGIVIVLAAWLIVNTIFEAVANKGFNPLQSGSGGTNVVVSSRQPLRAQPIFENEGVGGSGGNSGGLSGQPGTFSNQGTSLVDIPGFSFLQPLFTTSQQQTIPQLPSSQQLINARPNVFLSSVPSQPSQSQVFASLTLPPVEAFFEVEDQRVSTGGITKVVSNECAIPGFLPNSSVSVGYEEGIRTLKEFARTKKNEYAAAWVVKKGKGAWYCLGVGDERSINYDGGKEQELIAGASEIVFAHTHPSSSCMGGDCPPSTTDVFQSTIEREYRHQSSTASRRYMAVDEDGTWEWSGKWGPVDAPVDYDKGEEFQKQWASFFSLKQVSDRVSVLMSTQAKTNYNESLAQSIAIQEARNGKLGETVRGAVTALLNAAARSPFDRAGIMDFQKIISPGGSQDKKWAVDNLLDAYRQSGRAVSRKIGNSI
ncbi:MAG TPA: hypothetical protein VJB70_04895 [Candidatus Paceibacterota bacterium]